MTQSSYRTSKDAKDAGWFSRRQETREAHDAARAKYQSKARPAAKKRRWENKAKED